MSEQVPGRPEDDGPPLRRPAPSSYGAPGGTSGQTGADQPGVAPPSSQSPAPGQQGPVYGRVTRFGPPGSPSAPPPTGGWPPAGPYAPYGLGPHPGPGAGQLRGGPPWAGPVPPWPAPGPWGPPQPPRPQWRPDQYASWKSRVGSDLVDRAPAYVALVVLMAGYLPLYAGLLRGDLTALPNVPLFAVGMVLSLASTGWNIYNRWFVAGRTGQSMGKRVTKSWLVSADDGRPIGMLNAFLRDLLHILDGLAYVGYLWPLWDDQRQTLADKVIRTVVVRTPVPPLTEQERATRP